MTGAGLNIHELHAGQMAAHENGPDPLKTRDTIRCQKHRFTAMSSSQAMLSEGGSDRSGGGLRRINHPNPITQQALKRITKYRKMGAPQQQC